MKTVIIRINNALTVSIIALGLYILVSPFMPQIMYWINPPQADQAIVQVSNNTLVNTYPITPEDKLFIPRIGLDQKINSGSSESELNLGVWAVPSTSKPDKQSNTVLVGHRFTYAGPAVFYSLDKIEKNDRIVVHWKNKEYTYKVNEIKVVPPTEVSVQDPTDEPRLTLYTCTPLWSAKDRLVIIAPLVGERS